MEGALAKIWAEFLKFEHFGIHDNFFELGGHSLLATQVVNRIQTYLQIDISVVVLFKHPTVAQLAHELDEQLEVIFSNSPRPRDETE